MHTSQERSNHCYHVYLKKVNSKVSLHNAYFSSEATLSNVQYGSKRRINVLSNSCSAFVVLLQKTCKIPANKILLLLKKATWINVCLFSGDWTILSQANLDNITVSHRSCCFCYHGLFKAHLAWAKALEDHEAFYWSVNAHARLWAFVIGRRCCHSPLHSLLSTSPSLHRLAQARIFIENIHRRLRTRAGGKRCYDERRTDAMDPTAWQPTPWRFLKLVSRGVKRIQQQWMRYHL